MWFDGIRQPNTLYVASVSRGKDSTAMLRAIQLMGWPLDMIVAVDIWATDTIPAELPPMVAFKDEWDRKCFERFGVPVTRICATKKVDSSQFVNVERERERERERELRGRISYERYFYSPHTYGNTRVFAPERDGIYGFPIRTGAWCNGQLKVSALSEGNIRAAFLSCAETPFTESSSRERERERERQTRDIRVPANQRELVYGSQNNATMGTNGSLIQNISQSGQRVSHLGTEPSRGATISNGSRSDKYANGQGWATRSSNWCNSRLKAEVLDRPFLQSP